MFDRVTLLFTFLVVCFLYKEPTSVDLHVDGINDICTKEQDINFLFTGFSVLGTVSSNAQFYTFEFVCLHMV